MILKDNVVRGRETILGLLLGIDTAQVLNPPLFGLD